MRERNHPKAVKMLEKPVFSGDGDLKLDKRRFIKIKPVPVWIMYRLKWKKENF